jgi:hypothetical protein
MKWHARNAAWVLPLLLSACATKTHQPPIQQFAPPVSTIPKPPVLHPDLPASALVLPTESLDTDADALLDEAAKPVPKRRKPVVKSTVEPPAENSSASPAPAQQAAANESSEVPAIGVLSNASGDPADLRQETNDSITSIERGLRSIDRPLNGQEQKTASQIRQFIRQARKALVSGDVDGAHTLAAKAKVLLSELSD